MRASAFEFALAVDQQIEALPRQEFILRTGRAKRLQEELYPLSRLALNFKFPGVNVEVESFEDNGPTDGVIRFNGHSTHELHIQVTYVHSYEEALRRELLWKTGSTPVAGSIVREKLSGQIVAVNAIFPSEEQINQLATSIIELHLKKSAKRYPRGTILLIAFDDPTFYGQDLWRRLFAAIDERGGLSGGGFADVHIFNCGTNDLQTDA